MEKIESFKVNHLTLKKGLYVSRRDSMGDTHVTTFDIRLTVPNVDKPVDSDALHTIEHIFATYLRNSKQKDKIIYFGPMGCRTGCYLVTFGKLNTEDVYPLIVDACNFLISFEGEIPGAKMEECGNYKEQNLPLAKEFIKAYLDELQLYKRFKYE